MKAKIKFLRLDAETDEDELVFEIIPNSGNGVYAKNRWLVRVAQCFVDQQTEYPNNLKEQIEFSKTLISEVMGINEQQT